MKLILCTKLSFIGLSANNFRYMVNFYWQLNVYVILSQIFHSFWEMLVSILYHVNQLAWTIETARFDYLLGNCFIKIIECDSFDILRCTFKLRNYRKCHFRYSKKNVNRRTKSNLGLSIVYFGWMTFTLKYIVFEVNLINHRILLRKSD